MNYHCATQKTCNRNVAEIVVARDGYQTLLMPILAAFSQYNNRWLTWITDKVPCKKHLLTYNVKLQTLRLIYIKHRRDSHWLTLAALAQGNSHTVIAELDNLTKHDLRAMTSAAIQGETQGIIVRPQ